MAVIKYFTKVSKMIVFVVIALITQSCPASCGESQLDIKDFTKTEYKNYVREFQRVFGKQIEKEFDIKWAEGGFTYHSYKDEPQFFAYRRATREEARALVLAVVFKLREAVQADPIMLSYLNKSSTIPDFLGVDISFVYGHTWSYDDGSIDSVYSYYSKGDTSDVKKLHLRYELKDPFSDYSDPKSNVHCESYESLEDAIKLNALNTAINPFIHNLKEFEDELNKTLTSFEKEMKKKYKLYFRSFGWMVAGKATSDISEIRTKCTYYYSADCQKARALMLMATNKLLAALNNNEKLKPYLKSDSLSSNDIKLRILFREQKFWVGDVPYHDGTIESAVLDEDVITYYHHIPSVRHPDFDDRVVYAKESYQQAQKIFENTPQPSLFNKVIKKIRNFLLN